MTIPRVRGTHDILDMQLNNYVVDQIKKQLARYHFNQIETPILESVELFKRSLGLHTDVVNKEMFMVSGGNTQEQEKELLCLRPEATAPTMRSFLENNIQETPWKVFSLGPMFRYERPQKGRYRQFNQVSVELIAAPGINHDVQLIAMLDRLFDKQFQLATYALLINFLGCPADRQTYTNTLRSFLHCFAPTSFCTTCLVRQEKNLLRIFDCKNIACQEIYERAPKVTDCLCQVCNDEWQQLEQQLHILGISHMHEPRLVRGLDYYSKTVFEFVSENLGAQHTFCAGGRYDGLAQQLGSNQEIPAVGAAIGLERLVLLVQEQQNQLNIPPEPALALVLPFAKEQINLAMLVADALRQAEINTDILFGEHSIKSMMRTANKMRATWALLLGENEQATQTITIKHMPSGKQETIPQHQLIVYLKK